VPGCIAARTRQRVVGVGGYCRALGILKEGLHVVEAQKAVLAGQRARLAPAAPLAAPAAFAVFVAVAVGSQVRVFAAAAAAAVRVPTRVAPRARLLAAGRGCGQPQQRARGSAAAWPARQRARRNVCAWHQLRRIRPGAHATDDPRRQVRPSLYASRT